MPIKILVVDNEPRSRELIARFLREANYEVQEASDGLSAIEFLGEQRFDLIICDVVMPRLSGFDMIDYMKTHALATPVILITGHPELLAERGFGDLPFFGKPFNMYDLLRKVRETIRQ